MEVINLGKEPIITVAGITAAVSAVIALLVSFGLDLTTSQTEAIMGVVAVAAPLVVIAARRFVVPTGTLEGDH